MPMELRAHVLMMAIPCRNPSYAWDVHELTSPIMLYTKICNFDGGVDKSNSYWDQHMQK